MKNQIYFTCLLTLIFATDNIYLIMATKKLVAVDFEIYGRVQGVFFRKYTQQQAQSLGLRGWCMNTEKGTVQGCVEGEEPAVQNMKLWLKSTGSPQSKIAKAEFANEKQVTEYSFKEFKIRR